MRSLWDVDGSNVDVGYANLREASCAEERRIRGVLDEMWASYNPYADPDFPQAFARDLDARFWEMYLGCRLIEAGKTLMPAVRRPRDGGRPDICVLDGERRIWIEAIAPDLGACGQDQVRGPLPINEGGEAGYAPTRQAQLRMTSALWNKSRIIDRYLQNGVIAREDVRLIAIGCGRFGIWVDDWPRPTILSAVFPIGNEWISLDRSTGEVLDHGFAPSFEITRQGHSVSRTAFLDKNYATISGIIWSRVGVGNMSPSERPLTLVHNPLARIPMAPLWGVWDQEFVATEHDDHWEVADILAADSA